jgi:hypothetical protein
MLIQQEADSSALLQLEGNRLACVRSWLMEIVPKQGLLSMLKCVVGCFQRSHSSRAVFCLFAALVNILNSQACGF